MSRLEHAPEVIDLARELGVSAAAPVDGILLHCRTRIDRWVVEARGVTTIGQLEALVSQRLQMVFEEIRLDADFERITDKYARGKKDFVFAAMRTKFDDAENPTFGALVKRKNVEDDAPDRFVAVIDCRGGKLARRFFTRWHEVAHRLTTHADQGATEPAYRSEHDPIERMMDEIAGHVGFYGPFFEPVFKEAHAGKSLLTFDTVKAVQDGGFPDASFQATLNACAKRLPTPVMYLEAALAYNMKEKRQMPKVFVPPSDDHDDLPTISFSELASYEDCPLRYRLSSSFGFQPQLATELGYGKAIHHILRQVAELAKAKKKLPTAAEIEKVISEGFYLPFAHKYAFERLLGEAQKLVRKYLAN